MSLAIWDHTVLPATRHKWTHLALTPTTARHAGTCTGFTYTPEHYICSMDPPLVILICIAKRYTVSDLCGKPKFTPCTQEVAYLFTTRHSSSIAYTWNFISVRSWTFHSVSHCRFAGILSNVFFILNLTIGLTVFLFVHVYVSLQSVKLL